MALYTKRRIAALSGVLAVALTASACGSSSDDGGDTAESGSTSSIDCAPYTAFGDLKGKTVTVYTSITAPEDAPHIASYKPFVDCTGVEIKYEGSKEFEAQLPVRVKGGQVDTCVEITEDLPVGVVSMPYHFNEAPCNRLTNTAQDPITKMPELKACAVRVERRVSP